MSRFPFLGDDPRTYTQYLDPEAGTTLTAEPGNSYQIAVCPMYETADKNGKITASLTVPPGDGAWGDPVKDKPAAAEAAPKTGKGASE